MPGIDLSTSLLEYHRRLTSLCLYPWEVRALGFPQRSRQLGGVMTRPEISGVSIPWV